MRFTLIRPEIIISQAHQVVLVQVEHIIIVILNLLVAQVVVEVEHIMELLLL